MSCHAIEDDVIKENNDDVIVEYNNDVVIEQNDGFIMKMFWILYQQTLLIINFTFVEFNDDVNMSEIIWYGIKTIFKLKLEVKFKQLLL